MFTSNPDVMQQVRNFATDGDNICNVCGKVSDKVLYEFRCTCRLGASGQQNHARRFHTFVAYISGKCGQGLLGVQSEHAKLQEFLTRLVQEGNHDELFQL